MTLAKYADALTLMRDLQRNHPFVAGCAKRLGTSSKETYKLFEV